MKRLKKLSDGRVYIRNINSNRSLDEDKNVFFNNKFNKFAFFLEYNSILINVIIFIIQIYFLWNFFFFFFDLFIHFFLNFDFIKVSINFC
jgi:hypothetical protein